MAAGQRAVEFCLRLLSFLVGVMGGGYIAWGIYLALKFSGSAALWVCILAFGTAAALFGLLVAFWAYRSLFLLRLYGFIFGLLGVAEAAIAILFMVPDTRQRFIDAANLPDELKTLLEDHLTIAAGLLLGSVGLQFFQLLLLFLQCLAVDRMDLDLDDEAVSTGLLASSSRGDYGYGKRSTEAKSGDRFAALEDEGLAATASSKYQSRPDVSSYYEKYGVRRGK